MKVCYVLFFKYTYLKLLFNFTNERERNVPRDKIKMSCTKIFTNMVEPYYRKVSIFDPCIRDYKHSSYLHWIDDEFHTNFTNQSTFKDNTTSLGMKYHIEAVNSLLLEGEEGSSLGLVLAWGGSRKGVWARGSPWALGIAQLTAYCHPLPHLLIVLGLQ